jgi:hypothetical protein
VYDGTNWVEQGAANGVVTGALGQAFSPKIVPSSGGGWHIDVKVTPWSASSTKWIVTLGETVQI